MMNNKFLWVILSLFLAASFPAISHSEAISPHQKLLQASHESNLILEKVNRIRYQGIEKRKKEKLFVQLLADFEKTHSLSQLSPEQKVVYAVIMSCLAKEEGGLDALSLTKKAKVLLMSVLSSPQSDVLDGYAYVSLAALYLNVPRWPIAFGSTEEAKKLLDRVLAKHSNNIDANFYLAEFYIRTKNNPLAKVALEKVLSVPVREYRHAGDTGRKKEAEKRLLSIH